MASQEDYKMNPGIILRSVDVGGNGCDRRISVSEWAEAVGSVAIVSLRN